MGRARDAYTRIRRQAAGVPRRVRRGTGHHRSAGRVPVVESQPTRLGPVLDEAVRRAHQHVRLGVDPDYDLVYENFDVLHYLLRRRELLSRPDVDVVQHFLEQGATEEHSPHPDFSMRNYLRQYPEAARSGEKSPYLHWLKHGRDAGELADPVANLDLVAPVLGLEPGDVVERLVARRADLQQRLRTGRLGEMVAKAALVEPLVGAAWPAMTRPLLLPLTTGTVTAGISALHRAHEAAGFRRARVVLVVNQARKAPDLGVEGHLTHALAEHVDPGEIVVVYTDASVDRPARRHPAGVREIDLAGLLEAMPRDEELPDDEDAQQVLVTLLRTFGADAVVNIRSRLLFRSLRTYARALTASERLFLFVSGNEQTALGTWDGWAPHYLYRTFDTLAGVITDNDHFARHLADTYLIPPAGREQVHVWRTPVDPGIPVTAAPVASPSRRPQVFWSGVWGRQRKVDLLVALARRMPDVDFRVWAHGRPPASGSGDLPDNLVLAPGVEDVGRQPLDEADLWLHTAAWDAVPLSLLQVAMAGVPIVGTRVGGTSEVIGEESWPLAEDDGPEAYEEAIRAVLADPGDARRRAASLRERMLRERDAEAYAAQVARTLLTEQRTDSGGDR